MLKILKSLFRSSNQGEIVRKLSHPDHLREGDIVKFAYMEQEDLSNNEFEITKINTYIYGNICYPEIILKDRQGKLLYMMFEEEDGEEYLAISKKIDKADIEDIIGQDVIAKITSDDFISKNRTKFSIKSKPSEFDHWLVGDYREVDSNVKGSFLKGDARYLSEEQMKLQEKFISFLAEDKEGEYAIEIEVYDSGEIEVCASIYCDINQIAEMWPKNNAVAGNAAW